MADAMAPALAGAKGAPAQAVKLDDLMLAMDVVDTLRHQESFVARELDEDARERELIARLRKIYRDQGIEVSDATIEEGVKALKESRFLYTPPRPGLGVRLARLWIARARIGAILAGLIGAIGLAWMAYYFVVERPATQRAERAADAAEGARCGLCRGHRRGEDAGRDAKGRRTADRWQKRPRARRRRRRGGGPQRPGAAYSGPQAKLPAHDRIAARRAQRNLPHSRPQYGRAQLLSHRRPNGVCASIRRSMTRSPPTRRPMASSRTGRSAKSGAAPSASITSFRPPAPR